MEPAQAGTHWGIRHPVLFPIILFVGTLIGTAGGALLVGGAVMGLGQIVTAIAGTAIGVSAARWGERERNRSGR